MTRTAFVTSITMLSLVVVVGCKDPAADKPKATVTEPRAMPADKPAAPTPSAALAPTDQAAGTVELALTAANTSVQFTGSKVTGSHDGGFKEVQGTLHLNRQDLTQSRVQIVIDMKSVYSDNEKLTGHLMSPDFFAVEAHPTASLTSTAIVAGADGSYQVTADLQLRGVTKSITFPVTATAAEGSFVATSEFALNRQDFGVAYAGRADDLIRDDVVIRLRIDLQSPTP